MKGFIKMEAVDFDTFNNAATVKYLQETGDMSCTRYTDTFPDNDPTYVWVRIEHSYITDIPLLSYEDAIVSGMNINGG